MDTDPIPLHDYTTEELAAHVEHLRRVIARPYRGRSATERPNPDRLAAAEQELARRLAPIEVRGPTLHGVECYEAWRDDRPCPHEEPDR